MKAKEPEFRMPATEAEARVLSLGSDTDALLASFVCGWDEVEYSPYRGWIGRPPHYDMLFMVYPFGSSMTHAWRIVQAVKEKDECFRSEFSEALFELLMERESVCQRWLAADGVDHTYVTPYIAPLFGLFCEAQPEDICRAAFLAYVRSGKK